MNLIANVASDWGIGYKGKLLFPIPEDMEHFKRITKDKIVIMGHSTLLSLPKSKVLKNRVNIILSKNENLFIPDATVCNSIPHLMHVVSSYNTNDLFVIGGQTIYYSLLDYCSFAYITKVNSNKSADTYFPNLDKLDNWVNQNESEEKNYEGLTYKYITYANNNFSG